jgi:hypothetical protein
MEKLYAVLEDGLYHWERVNANTIWVALPGYKVFSDEYYTLMDAAKQAKAVNTVVNYNLHSMKTFYWFKHK